MLKYGMRICMNLVYKMSQLRDGKCLYWASFLSRPQNQKTCMMYSVAAITGSENVTYGRTDGSDNGHGTLMHSVRL